MSTSASGLGTQVAHWGGAAAIRYSRSGTRFGAVGEGGLVAIWRPDMASSAGIGYADWVHHVS